VIWHDLVLAMDPSALVYLNPTLVNLISVPVYYLDYLVLNAAMPGIIMWQIQVF